MWFFRGSQNLQITFAVYFPPWNLPCFCHHLWFLTLWKVQRIELRAQSLNSLTVKTDKQANKTPWILKRHESHQGCRQPGWGRAGEQEVMGMFCWQLVTCQETWGKLFCLALGFFKSNQTAIILGLGPSHTESGVNNACLWAAFLERKSKA